MAVEDCAEARSLLMDVSVSAAPAATTNARKEIIDEVSNAEQVACFVMAAKIGNRRKRSQSGPRMELCRHHGVGRG